MGNSSSSSSSSSPSSPPKRNSPYSGWDRPDPVLLNDDVPPAHAIITEAEDNPAGHDNTSEPKGPTLPKKLRRSVRRVARSLNFKRSDPDKPPHSLLDDTDWRKQKRKDTSGMESALRFDSRGRALLLTAREQFVSDDNVILEVKGALNTKTGTSNLQATLMKKMFPEVLSRIDVGACFNSESDEVTYSIYGKKQFELEEDGLTSLNLKGGYGLAYRSRRHMPTAKIELNRKIFNFTEDQDLKIKLGYDLMSKKFYGQMRENNWTLNYKGSRWDVEYAL